MEAAKCEAHESAVHGWYEEGWEAFYAVGRPLNPYGPASAAGKAWEDGWMAARHNDRECREAGIY